MTGSGSAGSQRELVRMAAGGHRLHFEYAPLGYRAGRWASLASGAVFLALASWLLVRRRAARIP